MSVSEQAVSALTLSFLATFPESRKNLKTVIMKKTLYLLCALFAMATMPLSSCSKDDPDPDNGQTVKPNETVADPTGTIQLSMRNNNETSLNGLKIGKDDNFHGDGWLLARVGEVNGLGNIYTIPAAGWTDKTSVLPGQGYVAYNRYDDEFYRLYVTEYILSATTQGVIGAEVKYQRPFKGMDEAIKTSDSKVAIPGEGGAVQVVFDNASIIPFKVTSSAAWCQVQKASTRDQWFLYDAIVISAEETLSGKEQTAPSPSRTSTARRPLSRLRAEPTANSSLRAAAA